MNHDTCALHEDDCTVGPQREGSVPLRRKDFALQDENFRFLYEDIIPLAICQKGHDHE